MRVIKEAKEVNKKFHAGLPVLRDIPDLDEREKVLNAEQTLLTWAQLILKQCTHFRANRFISAKEHYETMCETYHIKRRI